MILLTGFYQDTDASRQAEFLECLRRNVATGLLDEIHLVIEEPCEPECLVAAYPLLAAPKLRLVAYGRRVTYRFLFAYANSQLAGRRVIIANADIYFDRTLGYLDGIDLSGRLLCLSRWDVRPDGLARFFDHPGSQDAWIFQAPIREFPCDFNVGVLGCDNRLAWEAEHAGLAVSNPSRSLRAYHLHLSQVRRYSERQRLTGPIKPVPASFLDVPWLWFVVPCMGRLEDLRQTVDTVLSQSRSSYVLVDYACPEHAGRWARDHRPDILVASVDGRARFRGADARNRGAAVVGEGGLLCFLDADIGVVPGFSEYVLSHLGEGEYLAPDRQGPGYDSTLICRKTDFDRVGGFDETFLDWGDECADLRDALRRSGLNERRFPASLLLVPDQPHEPAGRFRVIVDCETNRAIHAAYRRAKTAILDETGGRALSASARREIYAAIQHRRLVASRLTPNLPCAEVAFRETMGYTIARLAVGVSSHNNDRRPFAAIPPQLAGLPFTQVVASSVSAVEVEFLSAGKLLVLVGNDWDGSRLATAWLCQTGFKERLPLVETSRGTGFEVWSLAGEAGEQFVLPTQVMLMANNLIRR